MVISRRKMPALSTGARKKRGVGSAAAPTVTVIETVEGIESEVEEPVAAAVKKKVSAAKKPVKVVAVVTTDGIEGSFTPEPRRPLIAHLQVKATEVHFMEGGIQAEGSSDATVAFGNSEPIAYDPVWKGNGDAPTTAAPTLAVPAAAPTPSIASAPLAPQSEKAPACFSKFDLMVEYRDASERRCLPERTDVACFWCAHTFEWQPCIIPEREVGGVYQVYGNFCTPQCAVAFLLTEPIDPHVRWERMALLQRIYDRTGRGRVNPAAARESLRLFGGPMSIDSFRAVSGEAKVRVDLHMPPMVSILGSIDTKPIDFFDSRLVGGAVLEPQKPADGAGGLRLKRTKPLKDRESTLDTIMKIRIGGKA
jgi:hypothetical protein